MKVTTKKAAMAIAKANPKAEVGKYSGAKLKWTGSQDHYVGRDISDLGGRVLAVWVERRTDKHGPYGQLMSLSEWEAA